MRSSTMRALGPTALFLAVVLAAAFGLTSRDTGPQPLALEPTAANEIANATLAANLATHDTSSDYSFTESEVVPITLNGSSASASNAGVTVSGSIVTITAAGTYRLTGSLSNGQVIVNAPSATVKLILNGASLTSSSCTRPSGW